MFEDSMTIFNKKYDPSIRDYEYIRTYIIGVNVDKKKAVNVIKSGLENASSGTIIIPIEDLESEDKEYISPKKYQNLSSEETRKYFTFQEGDIVVIGEIDYNINKENTITALKKNYDNVFEIISVDDKLKGGLPHWEIALV
jgi:hypothetical protein